MHEEIEVRETEVHERKQKWNRQGTCEKGEEGKEQETIRRQE